MWASGGYMHSIWVYTGYVAYAGYLGITWVSGHLLGTWVYAGYLLHYILYSPALNSYHVPHLSYCISHDIITAVIFYSTVQYSTVIYWHSGDEGSISHTVMEINSSILVWLIDSCITGGHTRISMTVWLIEDCMTDWRLYDWTGWPV